MCRLSGSVVYSVAVLINVDHVIIWLICVRGLVPNVLDSPEWKELMDLLNLDYHPTSATSFADVHIPCEGVFVCGEQIKY
jgi:hypothetical protein